MVTHMVGSPSREAGELCCGSSFGRGSSPPGGSISTPDSIPVLAVAIRSDRSLPIAIVAPHKPKRSRPEGAFQYLCIIVIKALQ